ncbi:hypothetical protein AB1Y20_005659 [Prymnesium parvum]|uniref:Uncharacterized protein n=1 Tax=Prymnesium parvum TaxID=97485 RepID=A0AB34J4Y2_PRYPA
MFRISASQLRTSTKSSAWFAGVLLICNNPKLDTRQLLSWIGKYAEPGVRPAYRMLIHTSMNMGYYCGELHALAASIRIWRRFAWVLYTSGPDCMLTPSGASRLAKWVKGGNEPARHTPEHPSFLGFPFLSIPGQRRWAMDMFVFWPHRGFLTQAANVGPNDAGTGSAWLNATRWCLFGWAPGELLPVIHVTKAGARADYSTIPEMLLNEIRERFELTFGEFPGGGGYQFARLKDTAEQPALTWGRKRFPQSLWHSHNHTAVELWIDRNVSFLQ